MKTASLDAPVGDLSGGNQQKVALARWLAARPKVLILDEPTQGVDVGAKAEIHRLMSELARGGLAIVMISSELPEVLGMSDRIAVMHGGTVVGVVDRASAIARAAHGIGAGHVSALLDNESLAETIMKRYRRELSVAVDVRRVAVVAGGVRCPISSRPNSSGPSP